MVGGGAGGGGGGGGIGRLLSWSPVAPQTSRGISGFLHVPSLTLSVVLRMGEPPS